MHPLAGLVLGVLAAFALAIGGEFGRWILVVLLSLGIIGALGGWVLAPKTHGARVAYRGLGRPILILSENIEHILTKDELHAILAHEMWHLTPNDRIWRNAANMLGTCAPALLALAWLDTAERATLLMFLSVAAIAIAAPIIQSRMLCQSESRADAEAFKILGSADALIAALQKLDRSSCEVHGLAPDEVGRDRDELLHDYVAELGGPSAVPRRCPSPSSGAPLNLSIEGEFLLSLVDGKRSVDEIYSDARMQHAFNEFDTYRLLCQLKRFGVIQTDASRP